MGKKKVIRHVGMTMTEAEHRKWHREHEGRKLTPEEHRKLMRHLGIRKQEDEKWHKAQSAAANGAADPVNPFAIGGGFLNYCVRQGWLIQQGRGKAMKYYVTQEGREALAEYGIVKY
jgi:hypothetical protein